MLEIHQWGKNPCPYTAYPGGKREKQIKRMITAKARGKRSVREYSRVGVICANWSGNSPRGCEGVGWNYQADGAASAKGLQ